MAVNNLIKLRRGTATQWSDASFPTLAQGEPGFDTTNNILKIGDGSTAWNLLAAVNNTDHPSISAGSSADNSGNTFIQDLTLDSNGHVTAIVSATASEGGSGGIGSVVEDTTPQLGGNLDLSSKDINGIGNIDVTGSGHFSAKVEADSFVKDGGTSSQFLKADGSVDSNAYITSVEDDGSPVLGGSLTLDQHDINIQVKNDSGSSISAGTPVYIAAYHAGSSKPLIAPANASSTSTMPAFGIVANTIADEAEGLVAIMGIVAGIDTTSPISFSTNDIVYVKAGGGLTNVKPTGVSEQIQNLGKVTKVHNSNGRILLLGAGRSNDIPNSGTFNGNVQAASFIKSGGTSSEFLKADGSVDTSTYLTAHPSISAASSSDNSGRTYIQDIGLDSNGHVTSITTETETVTDTNTQLTEEQVEDFVGGMLTGNTETGIAVTYQDDDGTIDFVVASQTDENFTTADHSKLDGIEASADVTDTANVTSAGALMDSELTDLAGVKGVTISTLQVKPSEGAFADGDKTKLDAIEASADVTDTANVTSAGALMDSEVTNLSQVKAFDSSDYATAAQGTKADSAQQPPSEGAFANGDKTKLDGIEASADVTDTANVTAAGALMDSELTDLAGVKGVTISTLQVKPSEGAFANGDKTKLDAIEASADVTDATNVNAAGAVMNSGSTTAGMSFVVDEDDMSSDSDTKVPTQQSVKAYVDATIVPALTTEQVQDIVGGMVDDTETGISVTYDDTNGNLEFVVDHDAANNFVANEHIDHTSVTLTASGGLIGGGDISVSRAFAVNVDDSTIEINSDALRIKDDGVTSAKIGALTDLLRWEYPDKGLDGDVASLGYLRAYDESGGYAGFGVSTSSFNIGTSGAVNMRFITAGSERAIINTDGDFIFNEAGANADFRVEGDTDANLLFLDASKDSVLIGNGSDGGINSKLYVYEVANTNTTHSRTIDVLGRGYSTTDGTYYHIGLNSRAEKYLSASTTDAGYCIGVNAVPVIYSPDGTNTLAELTSVRANMSINTAASGVTVTNAYDIKTVPHLAGTNNTVTNHYGLYLGNAGAGGTTPTNEYGVYQDNTAAINYFGGTLDVRGAAVFNEGGAAVDFRVEGDTDIDLLFVDGSEDTVQIGKLNINGAFTFPTADGSANQILKTDGNGAVSWAADGGGGGGGSMTTVKANGTQVGGADIVTLDFASDFTVAETPDTEVNVSIADGAISSAKMTTSTLVLNEAGASVDFRVEGDTNENLLVVDGSADKVGIGVAAPDHTLQVVGNAKVDDIVIKEWPSAAPYSSITHKDYPDSTYIMISNGQHTFVSSNANGITYVRGPNNNSSSEIQVQSAAVVINEGGSTSDFRVEGDADTHLLFVDAGLDKIGIGLSTPTEKLDVDGGIKAEGMYATTGLNVGVSGLLHQSGTIVHSTEAAWGEFPGNAQNSINLLTGKTTNATFTSLEMNNGMYSGVRLPSNKTFFADVNIVGRRTNSTTTASTRQHAAYQLKACITNDAFGRAIVGSVSKTVIAESNSAWDAQLAFAGAGSGQTDFLLIQCKGAASTNVHWVAKVDLLEVGGLNETSAYREANIFKNINPEIIP